MDGVDRPRLAGGARVVIAYRDQPDYAAGRGTRDAGRERFAAYQRETLSSVEKLPPFRYCWPPADQRG